MPDHAFPTETPNVVIADPKTRQRVYDVLAWAGLVLFAAIAADAVAPAFDISAVTVPASAAYGVLSAGLFGTARQNVPA